MQAVYQSLLHLSWIEKLLENVKAIFTSLYRDQFKKPNTSVIDCPFEDYFDRQVQALEKTAGPIAIQQADISANTEPISPPNAGEEDLLGEDVPPPPIPGLRLPPTDGSRLAVEQSGSTTTSTEATPIPTPDSSRPSSPASRIPTPKGGLVGRASRKNRRLVSATSAPGSRDTSASSKLAVKAAGKEKRRWDASGQMVEGDDEILDYSATADDNAERATDQAAMNIDQSSWGRKTGKGEVVLKDLDEEMESILASSKNGSSAQDATATPGLVSSGFGAISGLFRNVVGGKQLTAADLAKPLKAMEDHLINKNVAREAAVRLCDAVKRDLLDTKTASFQSVDASIRNAMEMAVSKIMTPSNSLDLLRSIAAVASSTNKRPYVISVVGVNGVGKSTTLSKLAFFLLHNNYRVLVCGADTFRSGAVEQLRVHVRNLQSLITSSSSVENPLGAIDLYERGYGKDPAHIARDAVEYAASSATPFDVVLIDTAGRRHNDSRLMSSLEGFARLAKPDKIFQVAEALVGSDSVAQARHFNESFGPGRRLDGVSDGQSILQKHQANNVSLVHRQQVRYSGEIGWNDSVSRPCYGRASYSSGHWTALWRSENAVCTLGY